jgi:hypothetical protein
LELGKCGMQFVSRRDSGIAHARPKLSRFHIFPPPRAAAGRVFQTLEEADADGLRWMFTFEGGRSRMPSSRNIRPERMSQKRREVLRIVDNAPLPLACEDAEGPDRRRRTRI